MQVTLTLSDGLTSDQGRIKVAEIGEAPFRVGRAPDCDLVLVDPGATVSRLHLELRVSGGELLVVSHGGGGTSVDSAGARLQTGMPARLPDQCRLLLPAGTIAVSVERAGARPGGGFEIAPPAAQDRAEADDIFGTRALRDRQQAAAAERRGGLGEGGPGARPAPPSGLGSGGLGSGGLGSGGLGSGGLGSGGAGPAGPGSGRSDGGGLGAGGLRPAPSLGGDPAARDRLGDGPKSGLEAARSGPVGAAWREDAARTPPKPPAGPSFDDLIGGGGEPAPAFDPDALDLSPPTPPAAQDAPRPAPDFPGVPPAPSGPASEAGASEPASPPSASSPPASPPQDPIPAPRFGEDPAPPAPPASGPGSPAVPGAPPAAAGWPPASGGGIAPPAPPGAASGPVQAPPQTPGPTPSQTPAPSVSPPSGGGLSDAASPAAPAPSAPQAAATQSPEADPGASGDAAALRAFFAAAGLDLDQVPPDQREAVAAHAGRTFRAMAEAMRRQLEARAEIKRELGVSRTMVELGANPLKFSPTTSAAVQGLMRPFSDGYLSGEEAVDDALADMLHHQAALVTAIRGAIRIALDTFDPASLETRLERGALGRVAPAMRRAELWRRFTEDYARFAEQANDDIRKIFGRELDSLYDAPRRRRDEG